jgi:hypothetical protein
LYLRALPTEPLHAFPARLIQDGFSGEVVLLPQATAKPGDPNFFMQRVAATTTPFGFPSGPPVQEVIMDRYLRPDDLFDEAVSTPCLYPPASTPSYSSRLVMATAPCVHASMSTHSNMTTLGLAAPRPHPMQLSYSFGPKTWPRDMYTCALDTVVISPARTTLIREEPDLLTAGLAKNGACTPLCSL